MSSIPSSQSAESNAPPPRGPHDRETRPISPPTRQPAQHRRQHAETAAPQRHGDRGDPDGAPLRRWVRFRDLRAANVVTSWPQLLRLIADEGFPPGRMFGCNTRAWSVAEVEAWLDGRPPPRRRDGAREQTASAEHAMTGKEICEPAAAPSLPGWANTNGQADRE